MIRAFLPALVVAAMVAAAGPASAGSTSQELYTEAQRAMLRSDTETAKQKFSQLLELDPKDVRARNSLRMIESQEKAGGGAVVTQRKLEKLVVPKVEFRDATLDSVLEFLRQQADKLSAGDLKLNFVVKLPPDEVTSRKVTLTGMTNIPMSELLKYVGELSGVSITVETHAVVVRPRGEPIPAPAAQP